MGTPVVLSTPRPAPSFTPMFVAIDGGFLAEEALDATIKYNVGVEGLLRGEIDFLGTGHGLSAFLKGSDIRLICGHSTQGGAHVLVVRPHIESVRQLKSVTVAAEENVMELRNIMAHYGIDLDKSGIETPTIEGSHPKQFEALKRGVGDGAMLGAPWWIYAVKEGYKKMGDGAEDSPRLPTNAIFATAEKIAKHPEQVRGFVRGYVKSNHYCRENVRGTLQTMLKYSREWGVDNPEIAKTVYDIFAPYWSAEVDITKVDQLIKLTSEKMGKPAVPPERFAELRFLQEALRELG